MSSATDEEAAEFLRQAKEYVLRVGGPGLHGRKAQEQERFKPKPKAKKKKAKGGSVWTAASAGLPGLGKKR